MQQSTRFCIIDGNGSTLTVRLQAFNALRAGAEFSVLDRSSNTKIETWEMAAGDSGSSDHLVTTPVTDLSQKGLTWEILCCSVVPGVDSGVVEIQVLQDGVTRPMTKPAQWSLSPVPQCDSNQPVVVRGSLIFLPAS